MNPKTATRSWSSFSELKELPGEKTHRSLDREVSGGCGGEGGEDCGVRALRRSDFFNVLVLIFFDQDADDFHQ